MVFILSDGVLEIQLRKGRDEEERREEKGSDCEFMRFG